MRHRAPAWVFAAWVSSAGLGCAPIFGIDAPNPVPEPDAGGAVDASVDDARDASSSDDATQEVGQGTDAGTDGSLVACSLASGGSCRGQCPGNASPCGCLLDPTAQTAHCGVAGSGGQGQHCASDADCAPGFGCLMTMGICAHWCRPGWTLCPPGTICQSTPSVTSDGEFFGYCY
jgi:hypothetical protein